MSNSLFTDLNSEQQASLSGGTKKNHSYSRYSSYRRGGDGGDGGNSLLSGNGVAVSVVGDSFALGRASNGGRGGDS